MIRRRPFLATALLLGLALPRGAGAAESGTAPGIHPGDRGYGLTVLQGKEPVRFEVEFLGTLPNAFPKGDLYLARVSGAGLEKTGVIAGMSGSPIWVGDRLVGALAYSWQFESEPIAGITPIESMRKIGEGGTGTFVPRFPTGRPALVDMLGGDPVGAWSALLGRAFRPGEGLSGGLQAAGIPLLVGGVAPSTVDSFSPLFRGLGLEPIPSGSARSGAGSPSGVAPRPVAGGSVAAMLVDGDLSVSAVGTVTEVDGDRVLAFGHPFLSLGPVELPLVEAEVVGVLPSIARSSKFGSTGAELGVVDQDRNAGIGATLGRRARTIPFELELTTPRGRETFHYRLADQSLLLPLLAALVGDSTLASATKGAGETTLDFALTVATPAGEVRWHDRFSGTMARQRGVASLGILTAWLAGNDVGGTTPTGFRLVVGQEEGLRRAEIIRVDLADRVVRAGRELRLRAHLREARGGESIRTIPLKIPRDFPPGRAVVVVADGRAATSLEFVAAPTDPRTPAEALELVSRIRSASRLTALLVRRAGGAIVDGRALPDLPPSVLALLSERPASPAEGGFSFLAAAEAGEELPFELEGVARIEIDVKAPVE